MSFFSPYHQFPRFQTIHVLLLAVVIIASIVASIQPLDVPAYMLHQTGTVLGMAVLLCLAYMRRISLFGYALAILFVLLHILGAHYLYSFVPYNDWGIHFLQININQSFGWSRNMYDRLVHFAYGLLLFTLCVDIISTWLPSVSRYKVALIAIQFIMASSLLYELIEWGLAIGLSPQDAENYNGQQGDNWDAHKDMALATVGALSAWLIQISSATINSHFFKRYR